MHTTGRQIGDPTISHLRRAANASVATLGSHCVLGLGEFLGGKGVRHGHSGSNEVPRRPLYLPNDREILMRLTNKPSLEVRWYKYVSPRGTSNSATTIERARPWNLWEI